MPKGGYTSGGKGYKKKGLPPSTIKGRASAKRTGGPIHHDTSDTTYSILGKHEKRAIHQFNQKNVPKIIKSLFALGAYKAAGPPAEAPVHHTMALKKALQHKAWKDKVGRAGKRIGKKK